MAPPICTHSGGYVFLAHRKTGSGFDPTGSGWVRAGGRGGFQFFSVRCRRCSGRVWGRRLWHK
ncbi:D-Glucuronyl C5-Epimerase [Manis pentadactyla]|nr:D-Glucuronyl C5-Epimerase [Manis pentadactyla]